MRPMEANGMPPNGYGEYHRPMNALPQRQPMPYDPAMHGQRVNEAAMHGQRLSDPAVHGQRILTDPAMHGQPRISDPSMHSQRLSGPPTPMNRGPDSMRPSPLQPQTSMIMGEGPPSGGMVYRREGEN
jgi:hypothetical protein